MPSRRRPTSASTAPSAAPEAPLTGGGIPRRRPAGRSAAHVGRSAKARTWIPWRARSSTFSCALGWLASLNNGVPPSTVNPAETNSASSLRASPARRAAVSCSHASSANAVVPIASAGPDTAHGPSSSRRRWASGAGCDGEAQPQAGQAIDLAEGAQDDGVVRQLAGKAGLVGQQVDEGFVDDQQPGRDGAQRLRRQQPAGRIVGIDHDHDVGVRRFEIGNDGDVVTVPAPVELVLGIGRPDDGDPRARHQSRQDLDQRLRAGRGDELAGLAAIALGGGCDQRLLGVVRRQA